MRFLLSMLATSALLWGPTLVTHGTNLQAEESTDGSQPDVNVPLKDRGYFGLHVVPKHNFDGAMEIKQVIPQSTAETAGVKINDRLISINGVFTKKPSDLRQLLSRIPIGAEVTFVLERASQQLILKTDMLGAPNAEGLITMNRLLRQQVEALERQVEALKDQLAGVDTPLPAVAESIASRVQLTAQLVALNETLSQLPSQLDATAQEFKELYPEGTFRVTLDIDIRSNAEAEDPVILSPDMTAETTSDEAEANDGDDHSQQAEQKEQQKKNSKLNPKPYHNQKPTSLTFCFHAASHAALAPIPQHALNLKILTFQNSKVCIEIWYFTLRDDRR